MKDFCLKVGVCVIAVPLSIRQNMFLYFTPLRAPGLVGNTVFFSGPLVTLPIAQFTFSINERVPREPGRDYCTGEANGWARGTGWGGLYI